MKTKDLATVAALLVVLCGVLAVAALVLVETGDSNREIEEAARDTFRRAYWPTRHFRGRRIEKVSENRWHVSFLSYDYSMGFDMRWQVTVVKKRDGSYRGLDDAGIRCVKIVVD